MRLFLLELPSGLFALGGDDVLGRISVAGGERRGRDHDLGLVLLGLLGFAVAATVFLGHRGFLSAGRAGSRDIRVAGAPRLFSPPCTFCLCLGRITAVPRWLASIPRPGWSSDTTGERTIRRRRPARTAGA